MRVYRDFKNPKHKEYKNRVAKIKAAHPDKFYDSDYHHTMLSANILGITVDAEYFATEALRHAAALGDTECCQDLRKYANASFNKKDEDGNTALMYAIKRKRIGTAEWLYTHGAQILPNKYGWDPILWAVHDGCLPALNMFHHWGVDFNQPCQIKEKKLGIFGKNEYILPLQIALVSKKPKSVQFLLEHGANIDKSINGLLSARQMLEQKSENLDVDTRMILCEYAAKTPRPVSDKSTKKSFLGLFKSNEKE